MSRFTLMRATAQAYQRLSQTPDGERVLADILKFCGDGAELMGQTSEDTAYNVGKHRVAQRIRGYLGMGEREFRTMLARQEDAWQEEMNFDE